jgi:chromo domain-containing protein 1
VPRYERIEIFPVGGFIYITEEVFEKKPQLALEIVKLFFAKIMNLKKLAGPLAPWQEVNDASLFWRLCVRPELMEYLFQICENHAIDLNAGNLDMQRFVRCSRYGLIYC